MSSSSQARVAPSRPQSHHKHALTIWAMILFFGLLVLALTYVLFVTAPPPKKLVIATGGKDGAYYQFAQKYAEELKKEGVTLEVRETAGSLENLQLLEENGSGVSVAIVQSGVARAEERDQVMALGSLYREPLWVFYRSPKPLDLLGQLAGKRIAVGSPKSGTYPIAMKLLAVNGLVDLKDNSGLEKTTLVPDSGTAAAQALQKGELDAAFFVAGFYAEYVQLLLKDENVRLMNFVRHETYQRKFRFLAPVLLPQGLVEMGRNIPSQDISLVAPTAVLVARKDLHPDLVPLLLATARHIHGEGDVLSNPGEFPTASYTDFPLSEDAKHYYSSGPPVLQRLLPFWLASLVDRLKIMLIPALMLLMPLVRAAPPLVRWRTRRKIYLWYTALREIDQKLTTGLSGPELDEELARLRAIENHVAHVQVPLSYMEEFYHLRLHMNMVGEILQKLRAHSEPKEERPKT